MQSRCAGAIPYTGSDALDRRHRSPGPQGRQFRSHRADARRPGPVRASRPGPCAAGGCACRRGGWRGAKRWRWARRRPGRDAAAAALGRSPARPQLHGRCGDVPATAARRPGLFPSRAAAAAATAPARPGPQRPGQGSQLAGAGRRQPGDHRLPARHPRRPALALDAAAGARGPAPPAQAQAHLLPAVADAGRTARAQAPFVAARGLVRHRQAGLPLRNAQAAEMGRQRRAGAEA